MSSDRCVYVNGRVMRDHQLCSGDLWVAGGKIVAPQPQADRVVDVGGLILAPGYIDLQINGAFGIDFTSEPQRVNEVALRLPEQGVTAFLPTLVSSPRERYRLLLQQLMESASSSQGAAVLGVHLEGPFLNPQYHGAHEAACVVDSFPASIEGFYGSLQGVRMVTLAPELPGAFEAIAELKRHGIVVSLGHSGASYRDTASALEAGAQGITHLFNAMTPLHQREPGMAVASLLHRESFYSLIVDGRHLHPAMVNLAWRCHPEGLVLITDAMAALGLDAGIYRLGPLEVERKGDEAMVVGTTLLAGSVLSMDQAVRNFKKFTGCSVVEAIEAATAHPAWLLGLTTRGTLEVGAEADFLLLDDDLRVQQTFIAGQMV